MSSELHEWIVPPEEYSPGRLDRWLVAHAPEHSRAKWQELIRGGQVTVNGQAAKPNHTLRTGDGIRAVIPPPLPTEVAAENIPLNVVYEDEDLIVINKPPGMVVHPAPGHAGGTLVNALLHHITDLQGIGNELRPGIVHRLDRETSGLLVAAKHERALFQLARQFKAREVRKEYVALVWGRTRDIRGTIAEPIGRDPRNRKKMSTRAPAGRAAVSHFTVLKRYESCTLVRVTIETGRTHQIRVHMAHLGHPVVGDTLYSRRSHPILPVPATRQLLHAEKLSFTHPVTGMEIALTAPIPEDFKRVLDALDASGGG